MGEPGPGHEADLAEACLRAPKFGINAKALILQAALAQDDEPPAQGPDLAAGAAAATARRGGEYLAAIDVKQRPLVAYLARSKIPRIYRQTVLNKLAGEHLALAAAAQSPPLAPAAAAADLLLRGAAFDAALAQELELFGRCGSAQVYQNLAARTSATQWRQAQQQEQAQGQQAEERAEQAQRANQGDNVQPPAAGLQQEQPVSDGPRAADHGARPAKRARPSGAAAGKPAARAAPRRAQLQECDLDWQAAPAADEQPSGAGSAGTAASAGGAAGHVAAAVQQAGAAAAPRPSSAQTELGSLVMEPLAQLPANSGQRAAGAGAGAGAAAAEIPAAAGAVAPPPPAAVAAAAVAAGAPGASLASAAGLPPALTTASGAVPEAGAAVRQQVALFVRAELHPLLKRQQIGVALHDAVCERCTAKVMACHAGATSADFLVQEAGSIRALVKRYLEHMRPKV